MKCKIVYTDEDQDKIQFVSDLQKQNGIRVIGYHLSSSYHDQMKLLDICSEEKISHLVVFELTVFGDRLDKIIKTIGTFFTRGIQIDLFTKEKIISLNSFSCFSEEALLVLFANLSSAHKKRIKHGQKVAKLSGKKIGRKPHISSDLVISLKREGLSLREISKKTGISITSTWRHSKELSEQ